MNVKHYRRMFAYNRWANDRVWQCVEELPDEQFNQHATYSISSVQQQLSHQAEERMSSGEFPVHARKAR